MVLTFQSATSSRFVTPLDLQSLFWKTQKLPKDISSIQGYTASIGGKPVIEKTSNGTVTGDKSKKLRRVDVRFSFNGIASVRETNITLSGSQPWEMMYRVLVRLVPDAKSLTFQITNTAVRFYLKRRVKIDKIASEKVKKVGYTMTYEPELYFSKLTIKFSDGIVASVFANGTVVAQGKNLTGIEKRVKDLLSTYSDPYGEAITKSPVAARRNLPKKRLAMIESRYELANSWTNTRPGMYVRPGPNKRPRFYEIPKNPAFVRQKVLRAYKNVGVNVPLHVKQVLGISNTKVKPKVVAKKTLSNWNANAPNGMYIRPGPGGLPKFYKIPKLIKQGKKTVLESYKKAGVRVPNKVRKIFGISPSPVSKGSPLSKNVSLSKDVSLSVTNKGVFRVDGLACSRYKLDDLKIIAKRFDIPVTKRTKSDLCRELRKKMQKPSSSLTENFVKNGVKYYILANERRVRRNTRNKAMNSFKIDELKNMIRFMNDTYNVSGKKKKELIDILIERKRTKNELNKLFNMSPSSNGSPLSKGSPLSRVNSTRSSSSNGSPLSRVSSTRSPSPARNPLNIARNILGNGFSNKELAEFLNRYMRLPKTPGGSTNKIAYENLVNSFKQKKLKPMLRVNIEKLA